MGADDQQLELLGALEALGGSAGNGKLRDLLGWDEATYEAVKAPLVASGQLRPGRGRGGSVNLADGSADISGMDGEDAAVQDAIDARPRTGSASPAPSSGAASCRPCAAPANQRSTPPFARASFPFPSIRSAWNGRPVNQKPLLRSRAPQPTGCIRPWRGC